MCLYAADIEPGSLASASLSLLARSFFCFATQDHGPLTGVLCGPAEKAENKKRGQKRKSKKTRYYRHRKGRIGYKKGSSYNKMIAAEPLEKAILELIREIITDAPEIKKRIIEAVAKKTTSTETEQELTKLRSVRDEKARRIQWLVRNLKAEDLEEAKSEFDQIAEQCRELDRQIAELDQELTHLAEDPGVIAKRVVDRLADADRNWGDLSANAKRELVQQFVERVDADLVTKEVAVSLRLPPWAIQNGDLKMRLANSSASQTIGETHPLIGIPLAYAECHCVRVPGRSLCCPDAPWIDLDAPTDGWTTRVQGLGTE